MCNSEVGDDREVVSTSSEIGNLYVLYIHNLIILMSGNVFDQCITPFRPLKLLLPHGRNCIKFYSVRHFSYNEKFYINMAYIMTNDKHKMLSIQLSYRQRFTSS